jgi:hypothetical protein
MGRRGLHTRFWQESQKEKDHHVEHALGGWIILELILDMVGWYGLD